MSILRLVRHGQASFLDGEYDRLSALGTEQARRLGQRWAEARVPIDAVFAGPRRRHVETAEALARAMREARAPLPEIVPLPELDEYRATALLDGDVSWVAEHAELAPLLEAFRGAAPDGRARAFEHLFQALMRLWQAGRVPGERIEPWHEFRARVARALATLTAEAGGRSVVAISSAGAIGAMIGGVLRAPPEVALELGWVIHNASVSELLFSRGRITLSRFNAVDHLEGSRLTYR